MKLNYFQLHLHWDKDKKRWDRRCVELMHELFDFNYGNSLVITHPNSIFNDKLITKEQKDIKELDWENVKDFNEVSLGVDDYKITVPGDYTGFTFIHRKMRNELFVDGNYRKRLKTEHPRFLVVYETSNMRVRAIFRGTENAFEVAFNPEFVKKCSDQTIFEIDEDKNLKI